MSTAEAQKTPKKIHRQMTIDDILNVFPHKAQKLAHAMSKAGLQCAGCHASTWETLEAGMFGHGMTDRQIDTLVVQLNDILEEKTDNNTVSMTARAANKYREILKEEGKEGWSLRFGEEMAGCNGFEYVLDYSEKALPDDTVFHSHGMEIHVNNALVTRVLGSEIDYIDGLHSSGFKVSNPHVRSSCGCGHSHGY